MYDYVPARVGGLYHIEGIDIYKPNEVVDLKITGSFLSIGKSFAIPFSDIKN